MSIEQPAAALLAGAPLAGLLQLASAALPVGAFSHSLGLEAAVEAGAIVDAASAAVWIDDQLMCLWATGDAPLWLASFAAWQTSDGERLQACNDQILASRESQELLLECTQTGHSLRLWLLALPALPALSAGQRHTLATLQPISFPCVHALAAHALSLPAATGLYALGWSLLENLCSAALKLVPLGQTQGQALLRQASLRLPEAIATALTIPEHAARSFAPMLAIRSAQHESQYSRLFRS